MRQPFGLHFRLRSDRTSPYKQIYLRLRVGDDKTVDLGTGVFVRVGSWRSDQKYYHRRLAAVVGIDNRLDAIRKKVGKVYSYQQAQSQQTGQPVTARTVVNEYRAREGRSNG